jgi:hypothetical protein
MNHLAQSERRILDEAVEALDTQTRGQRACIFFAWPEGRRQISSHRQIGKGLSFLGESDWVFVPPSMQR